jgi:ubiquinone/menaquinone biosynthesis C-methylase UbiE
MKGCSSELTGDPATPTENVNHVFTCQGHAILGANIDGTGRLMSDPYASIADAERSVQQRLAEVLELRAAEPQQQAMLREHLSEIALPPGARALEIGCGTGAVSRALARWSNLTVVGVDPSPIFLKRARELSADLPGVAFLQGDGRSLSFPDGSFDLALFHTTLCHVPDPLSALREAHRILRPGGLLSVFDGDYTTTSVAISGLDPLQPLVQAMIENFVHDRWLTRRLSKLVSSVGFETPKLRSHGYLQTAEPGYMLTIIDRGSELLAKSGTIRSDAAAALREEARRRAENGEFYGHISFVGLISRKRGPGSDGG